MHFEVGNNNDLALKRFHRELWNFDSDTHSEHLIEFPSAEMGTRMTRPV